MRSSRWIAASALSLVALVGSSRCEARTSQQDGKPLEWVEHEPLPDPIGVAGAVVGVLPEGLLVAGGANFPDAPPWEGGAKAYHDRAYLLGADGSWRTLAGSLPDPLAYGVCATTRGGVIVAGGHDGSRVHAAVSRLRLVAGALVTEELPSLPEPRTNAGGALIGTRLFVVGGQTDLAESPGRDLLMLDLAREGEADFGWQRLEPLPGSRRSLPVVANLDGRLLVASGRDQGPLRVAEAGTDSPFGLLEDLWIYEPSRDRWEGPLAGTGCVMGAGAVSLPDGRVWIFGGDDGRLLLERSRLDREGRTAELGAQLREHPGFSSRVLEVSPSGEVELHAQLSTPLPVTTPAVVWNGRAWLVSGESRPGIRTPRVRSAELPQQRGFGLANWWTLIGYLAGMLLIGLACRRRIHDAEDFFLAGRRIPGWAAGLSIFGTQLSAITFMAVPATAYGADWSRMVGSLTLLVVLPLAARVFVPVFRRSGVSTAYQLLGQRFGPRVQRLGASLFVLVQLGRMGIVLFLPAVALAAVTGISVVPCILLMGVLCTAYTVLGGFEAVVWTDVAQVIVLLGGALVALVVAISGAGGLGETLELALAADKLQLWRPGIGLDEKTLPTMLLATLVLNLIPYVSDQTVVQRYLATPDEGAARRSLWINFLLTVPAALVFYGLGTALFAFYASDAAAAAPPQADHLVPWFVVHELPGGLAGLVVAAIFAASMSSLDSSMNSVATVLHHDFGLGGQSGEEGARALSFGRWATLGLGALGTGAALLVAAADVKYLFDLFNQLLGFFGGALAGVFVLAVLRPRTRPGAAGVGLVAGALAGALATFFLVQADPPLLDGYLVGAVGFLVTLGCGALWPSGAPAPRS